MQRPYNVATWEADTLTKPPIMVAPLRWDWRMTSAAILSMWLLVAYFTSIAALMNTLPLHLHWSYRQVQAETHSLWSHTWVIYGKGLRVDVARGTGPLNAHSTMVKRNDSRRLPLLGVQIATQVDSPANLEVLLSVLPFFPSASAGHTS